MTNFDKSGLPCPEIAQFATCEDGTKPVIETTPSGCKVQKCPGFTVDPNGGTPNGTKVCWHFSNVGSGIQSQNITGTITDFVNYNKYEMGTRYLVQWADNTSTWVNSNELTVGACLSKIYTPAVPVVEPPVVEQPSVPTVPTSECDATREYKIPVIGCVKKETAAIGGAISLVGLYLLTKK